MFGDRNNVLIEPPAPAAPMSGVPGGHGPGEGEVHLLDRLSVLYRYRKVVITVVFVVLIAGVLQTMTTTPEYMATARIQVDNEQGVPGLQQSYEQFTVDWQEQLTTLLQALGSRDLIRTIVGPLGLANNPEFNGTEAPPTAFGGALAAAGSRVIRPIRELFGSTPPPPQTPPGSAQSPSRTDEDTLVDAFLARMHADLVPGSRNIAIDFVSRDPEVAAAAANILAETFVVKNLERRQGSLKDTVDLLAKEVEDGEKRIQQIETEIAKYTATNGMALADPSGIITREADLDIQLQEAVENTRIAQQAFDAVKDIRPEDDRIDSVPDLFKDPVVNERKARVSSIENEIALSTLGEGHPERIKLVERLKAARSELVRARTLVVDNLRTTLDRARASENARRKNLDNIRQLRADIGGKGIDYGSLTRYRDAEREVLNDLQSKLATTNVQRSAVRNNMFVVEKAVAPQFPFKPDVSRNLLIALFVGIALAGALAFGLDYLDDTIKTPEDITRKLRVPFLGLVPSVRGDKQPVLSGPVPHDFGEAYRALRTSLVFTSGGESTRIITCTSAQPLEGKTTTACNLAMVLAFGGSRVLLIDADMRRPGVHKALKINNTVGLSHLLVGQARVREAIQRTSDPNFCVMTAGRTPPNPSELLSSERMKQLVANLKQGPFDWVVIDTPPVLAVTDAVILTPLVDGVTFILGAEMTRRRLAERAVQMLMVSRPKVVGAVLNRVNFDRNKYYYSRYYGYQYKSYYGSSSSGSTVKS